MRPDLYRTKTDGSPEAVSDPILDELKDVVQQIATDTNRGMWTTRVDAENTRLCKWDGQAPDGRKHAAYNADEEVLPFEGACDQRIRLADMLVNEDVMLFVLAALRSQVQVTGVEADDTSRAGKMQILLNWILRNMMGLDWLRELILLANYTMADSPAVALMAVKWRQKIALALKVLTVDELLELYQQLVMQYQLGADPEISEQELAEAAALAAEDFRLALEDPGADAEALAETLRVLFPYLKPARARKVIKALRQGGRAEFPVPYMAYNGPEVQARRFFKEWFCPANTATFQDARMYFEVEWLTKAQVLERQVTSGWADQFVNELVGDPERTDDTGKEGVAAFREYEWNADGFVAQADANDYKGLYQVLTAYFVAANEDGIPGRYYITFHPDVTVAATPRQMVGYEHGKYPGHVFQRECLTRRLLDTRGIPELAASHQDMLKLFADSFGDVSQLSGAPPVITRGRRGQGRLYIEPLGELQAKRDGDYKWMAPPQYPNAIDKMMLETRRQIDEYFGRSNEQVPPDLVQMHREFKTQWWLANLREVLVQIMQLAQQYMAEEQILRVTNSEGNPIFRSRDEIQGQYDISITFDAREFDPEYLRQLGETIRDVVMAMDREQTVNAQPIVQALMWRLMPSLAERSIRPIDDARKSELDDEWSNYLMITAGREPNMDDTGRQNYALRLQMYQNLQQANPQIYASLAQDRQEILQARIQHLQVMSEQYGENAQIGRQGARPALQGGPNE